MGWLKGASIGEASRASPWVWELGRVLPPRPGVQALHRITPPRSLLQQELVVRFHVPATC